MVAGFPKGKWASSAASDAAKGFKFNLDNSTDKVVYNARVVTVGSLVNQRRLTADADEARVCYHDIVEAPTADGRAAFKLKSTQEVYYNLMDINVAKEEGGPQFNQHQVGSSLPTTAWESKFTSVLWVVKWVKKKGIQPTRPQVCWVHEDTVIEPGKALLLVGPA